MSNAQQVITIVRTAALGDAVQMTPMLRQIRSDLPNALIRCFTSMNSVELFQGAPFVDEVIGLQSKWTTHAAGLRGMLRAWFEVARHGFVDTLISLEPTLRRNLGAWQCLARRRAGFVFEDSPPLHPFTHSLRCSGNPRTAATHSSELYLKLWTKVSGFADRDYGYDMHHLPAAGGGMTLPESPYACLAPGAGNAWVDLRTKRWPASHFVTLGRLLMEHGWQVAYLGGRHDLEEFDVPAGAVNLLGKTTIPQAAFLLANAVAMFGNDSGLYHLGIAVGCPSIAAFGPTDDRLTGPFRAASARVLRHDLPCAPCYATECLPPREVVALGFKRPCCLHAVTPQEALRAMVSVAAETHSPSRTSEVAKLPMQVA
jgi:ADP-heptose:LPS heptosyltransferase